jgi:maleylacetoacetate isomerase
MIRLYDYWRSSASYRVRIALNLLDLRYESVSVNLLEGAQRGADNLARNPQGLVPTLEIDGLVLTQSLAIIEYLNDTRGGLLPADAAGKTRVRAISDAIAMEIAPVCNLSVRTHVTQLTGGTMSAEDWQRHYIGSGLAAVERMLNNPQSASFCHGDAVTMADICLVPQIYNAQRVGFDLEIWPNISRIFSRLSLVPAVLAAHPEQVKP